MKRKATTSALRGPYSTGTTGLGGDAEVVEALGCKADLSRLESHRYLRKIPHS